MPKLTQAKAYLIFDKENDVNQEENKKEGNGPKKIMHRWTENSFLIATSEVRVAQ